MRISAYKYLSLAAAAVLALASCSGDEADTTKDTTYFRFTQTEVTINKTDGSADIEISWVRTLDRSATLELYVSTDGITSGVAAVEGTDFTVSEKSVSFGKSDETRTVTVTILPGMTGTKSFRIVMKQSSDATVSLGQPGKLDGMCLVTLTE